MNEAAAATSWASERSPPHLFLASRGKSFGHQASPRASLRLESSPLSILLDIL